MCHPRVRPHRGRPLVPRRWQTQVLCFRAATSIQWGPRKPTHSTLHKADCRLLSSRANSKVELERQMPDVYRKDNPSVSAAAAPLLQASRTLTQPKPPSTRLWPPTLAHLQALQATYFMVLLRLSTWTKPGPESALTWTQISS